MAGHRRPDSSRESRRPGLSLLIIAALCLCGTERGVAQISPYGQLKWRSIGPFRGGRVLAVTGAADNPQHFYFGAVNGGVWETRDAGRTWAPISDALPVGSIGAIALAPSAPGTLYVGTGEADMRSDIAQGLGMFKTTDDGRTWTSAGLGDSRQIAKVLVDPSDANTVLVAALGHAYGPSDERGVFRSTDGGKTWTRTLFKDRDTGAIDLVADPSNPKILYAALWQTRRPPWNVYSPSSGPGSGMYKSTDGGVSWSPLSGHGLPDAPGRIGIAVAPTSPGRVYALIDAKTGGGLYRSDNAGGDWVKVTDDKRIWQRGWYFGEITVNPKNADQIWVANTIMLRSDDGGRTFLPEKGDPTGDDFHQLWIDPTEPTRRILGVDQGALVTLNGGATWSTWFNQPTGQFYHVATDNRFPYRVYGAQQDSGAADVPSRTGSWDGIDMTEFHELTPGGESDNIAPDPADPDTIYGGRVNKLDRRTDQVRNIDPTLAFPDHYRVTWTLPLTFGPGGKSLYFSNHRLFRTRDGGDHWLTISPDLTRPDPGTPVNLDAPAVADVNEVGPRRGVIYAIGPSPLNDDDVWAGTDDGRIWRTHDGGPHWRDLTPSSLQPWSKVASIEPSHFRADVAYVAIDRHRLDDFAPYILRTRDGGASWATIVAGLADGGELNTVNVVREDPKRAGLLYAGTERGVFVSFNDGEQWSPLQNGLPITSVRDITIHGDDLAIATHGRGFWILDDVAALRDWAADPQMRTRLFAPAMAARFRPATFTGTPKPKDEPMAANPPPGAPLDYFLAADARGTVSLEIRDANGALVRRFSSDDSSPVLDLATLDIAPEWAPAPTPLSTKAGAHRAVWDLRYDEPKSLRNPFGPGGVWAPPGDYQVVLTVDGHTSTGTLHVAPDPRVTAPPARFAAEFAVARLIEADRAALAAAIAAKPTLAKTGGDLVERLAKLQSAVDGADGGPTADAKAGYALAHRELIALLAPAATK